MAGKKVVALEVCMYGNREIGFGFLAVAPVENVLPGKGRPVGKGARLAMFGTGEAGSYSSLTETLYAAQIELREAMGPKTKGEITVFLPGGMLCAPVELGSCANVGDLKWGPAPVYTLEVK